MFSLKFNFEFIADNLLSIAEHYKIDRKNAVKILRDNEDKFLNYFHTSLEQVNVENKLKAIKQQKYQLL
jgi:hypothetical protein